MVALILARLRLVLVTSLVLGCGVSPPALWRLGEVAGEGVSAGGGLEGVTLGRLTVPCLPGRERWRRPLPAGFGGERRFEVWLGLRPEAPEGAVARFTARFVSGEAPWLEEMVWAERGARWQRRQLALELPPRGEVLLEVVVRDAGGRPLAPELACWGSPMLRRAEPPERRELNLVILAIDSLRADMLGAYGGDAGLTPHLDELASRSVRFADLTTPSPWTLPSFATLLTGLQPQTHGAGQRQGDRSLSLAESPISGLGPGPVTLGERLGEHGFRTAGFYTNPFLSPAFGIARGFDEYHAFPPATPGGTLVQRAHGWLRRHAGERFFLFLQLLEPHTPYHPTAPLCEELAQPLAPKGARQPCRLQRTHRPERRLPPELHSWGRALYRAEVAASDRLVGQVVDALEATGLSGSTLLLVISDHGEELWERRGQAARLGYHAVADHGHTHYQELLHVPAILHRPGRGAVTLSAAAELADLFPTLVSLLGVEASGVQGGDWTPWLDGAEPDRAEPLRLADFLLYGPPRLAVRRGPWKLIVPYGGDGPAELYHLGDDPGERENLATTRPDLADRLLGQALAELEARRRAQELLLGSQGPAPPVSDERRRELEALGYF